MDLTIFNHDIFGPLKTQFEGFLPYASVVFWVSLVCFLVTLFAALATVYYLPHDHFLLRPQESMNSRKKKWLFKILIAPLKNALGLCLLCIGLVLLVLPGQGLVTILMALLLLDMPGKDTFKAQLIANIQVRRSLNWLRSVLGKAPFAFQNDNR